MSAPATKVIVMADFPGIIPNMDPRDLPDGAAEEQVNAACLIAGELTIRRGLKEVTFEN